MKNIIKSPKKWVILTALKDWAERHGYKHLAGITIRARG